MRLLDAAQMRGLDQTAIVKYNTPARDLMNCAALRAVDVVKSIIPDDSRCAVICGNGNNGGDGFAVARLLNNANYRVSVFFDNDKRKSLSDESGLNHDLVSELVQPELFPDNFDSFSVIIDAYLGIGIKGKLRENAKTLVEAVNRSGATVISLDIPSGLPTEGYIPDNCVAIKADYTVTFGFPKVSMFSRRGREYCGTVITADIGLPSHEILNNKPAYYTYEKKNFIDGSLLYQNDALYKTRAGCVTVFGGFRGYEGAAILSVKALSECGNGMTYLAVDSDSDLSGREIPPEVMLHRLDGDYKIHCDYLLEKSKTVVCGPGLGLQVKAKSLLSHILLRAAEGKFENLILDGDALTILADTDINLVKKAGKACRLFLTPHSMEAARLSNVDVDHIDGDSAGSAIEISKKYDAYVVLKGPATVTAYNDEVIINTSGNPLLATGGSGDVLTGIIASFIRNDESIINSVSSAVFLHGYCADYYYGKYRITSYKASDTINMIRPALKSLLESIDDH
ncbi:MAG: NAD(P)H-hydrate dehydratase [Spirochaetes bacterium]|nr:NAD(P)H-hydrate dehydratase [Spirochaetota bacterium]MBN2770528.1 NAD(P)H-hydrate dehydratase [Spirochaetota bacterium]